MTVASATPALARVSSADGTRIGIWCSGDGPPLLLVHGAAADHSRWAPVLPVLERRFTVLAIDRRGRGASDDVPAYAIEREYEDIVAVAEWAGEAVSLLGHSHGALCALEATLLTNRIARLVLYEAAIGFLRTPRALVEGLQALLHAGEHDALLERFLAGVAGLPPDQVALLRSLPAWGARRAAAHTIPREEQANRAYVFDADRFRSLAVPTLLLGGSDSPAPFQAANHALRAALPDARLAVLPGQCHAAMDTGPELFLAAVLPFLDSTASTKPPSRGATP
jgi:pimeloyl-ACP methyl ester carboxylesterase